MADEHNKTQEKKVPGENPDGTFHYNPGNMAGKTPSDADQTAENRGEPKTEERKPAS